jgi:hypothetical protein
MPTGDIGVEIDRKARSAAVAYLIAVPLLTGAGALIAWAVWRAHITQMPELCTAHDSHGNCAYTFPVGQLVPWFAIAAIAAALASRTIARALQRSQARARRAVAITAGVALVTALAMLSTTRMTLAGVLIGYASFAVLVTLVAAPPFRGRQGGTIALLIGLPPAMFVLAVLLLHVPRLNRRHFERPPGACGPPLRPPLVTARMSQWMDVSPVTSPREEPSSPAVV